MSETFAVRCKCGHGQSVPKARECVCCQEFDKIKALLVGNTVQFQKLCGTISEIVPYSTISGAEWCEVK